MKTLMLLFTFNMCLLPLSKAQLNIELLHQLVAHSKQEYEKQQTLRSTQVVATANQEINSQQTAKLKSRYREITGRFQVLGTADRKSTRLNSSHVKSSYAVFCLK